MPFRSFAFSVRSRVFLSLASSTSSTSTSIVCHLFFKFRIRLFNSFALPFVCNEERIEASARDFPKYFWAWTSFQPPRVSALKISPGLERGGSDSSLSVSNFPDSHSFIIYLFRYYLHENFMFIAIVSLYFMLLRLLFIGEKDWIMIFF